MDLFESQSHSEVWTPLAERLRPRSLDDFVGQQAVLGPSTTLRRRINAGDVPNMILWGPPGCGKTTLAQILSTQNHAKFLSLHAVSSGAKELRQQGEQARERKLQHAQRTLVFVDEIHRFNKGQQDVLLPYIERGDFVLVGATTENPSYELNKALLSRCHLVVFQRLDESELLALLRRAGEVLKVDWSDWLTDSSINDLIGWADGDARRLLNAIENIMVAVRDESNEGELPLARDALKNLLGEKWLGFDKRSDSHYDTVSAFIKSLRGSDPDAGLYYLARMLEGGEDPKFIARRLIILASEDVGNADPRALPMAVAGMQAVEMVGLPEAAINLAQVVTYLATAPKSNRSYLGLRAAQREVRQTGDLPIPKALRSAQTPEMKKIGYGRGYSYAHDGVGGWADQEFFPNGVGQKRFYEPVGWGYEKAIRSYLEWIEKKKRKKKDSSE